MPKQQLVLTPKQAYELKWFCKNVTGITGDFHRLLDKTIEFKQRLERLEETSRLIENFLLKISSVEKKGKEECKEAEVVAMTPPKETPPLETSNENATDKQ